jgi:hypothetical protein
VEGKLESPQLTGENASGLDTSPLGQESDAMRGRNRLAA